MAHARKDRCCRIQHWETWQETCCSVKVVADEGAEFTVGVYKCNGCEPSMEHCGGYKLNEKIL